MSDEQVTAALTDAINELTRPRTHREPYATYHAGTWTHERHHTRVPSLLDQLAEAVEPSSSGDGGRTPPGSKPTARLEAIDVLLRIQQAVLIWTRHAGLTERRTLPDDLHALLGAHNQLEPAEAWDLATDARRWVTMARVVTGWEVPPFKPNSTCPLCSVRGSLRIRVGDGVTSTEASALCTSCHECWDGSNISLLADHIRYENQEEDAADVVMKEWA